MRVRAYSAHPSIRDQWALRSMSRCPDQMVSLKRDSQCLSPRKLSTHLSTHCSRDERRCRPFPAWELNSDLGCGSGMRYPSITGPLTDN
ncbi:uncharacterized protein TNCV_4136851 [Trichonephila clavipes]|nr:uncharacterized protein TNCV_4136851 [Trichonephila clavipes]